MVNESLLAPLLPAVAAQMPPPGQVGTLGVPDAAKPAVIAALAAGCEAAVVALAASPRQAAELLEALPLWLPPRHARRITQLPARETAPYERQPRDADVVEARLAALDALAHGVLAYGAPILITDADAVTQATLPAAAAATQIAPGQRFGRERLIAALEMTGYERRTLVVQPADYAVRGGIVDLWPPGDDAPVRIELFGEEIESLRRFDPATQRSYGALEGLRLSQALETTGESRALAAALAPTLTCGDPESEAGELLAALDEIAAGGHPSRGDFWTPFIAAGDFFEHLPEDALLIVDERADLLERGVQREERAEAARVELGRAGRIPRGLPLPWRSAEQLERALDAAPRRVELSRLASPPQHVRLPFRPVDRFAGKLAQLFDRLDGGASSTSRAAGRRFVVSLQEARLAELMIERGLSIATLRPGDALPEDERVINVGHAALPEGWQLRDAATDAPLLTLISDTEIFGFAKQRPSRLPRRAAAEEQDAHLLDRISPGDYVVHIEHGIARFHGVVRERVGDREGEYLDLRYAQDDRLLVPTDHLERVQPYIGASDRRPALTRLGTQQWSRARGRAQRAVREIAEQLLALQAERDALPGIAMGPDTPWQIELEASFPYLETPEQHAAIEQVRRDQESASPMDRIVIGDVGYGKTEVAVRAAFKAVTNGYQAAVLAPTTVLAQQHAETFAERLAAMPVTIEALSRLRSGAEQRDVVGRLKSGQIDIVIGTHRLLQEDVNFRNLGLVVIDEEQRFGVEHKERLKSLRREVDVLTLSATPIPRSLHQALTGIRDMSSITTPPEERLPITTHLLERDDSVIREAILRELEREGQVYFLHNEVRSIERETAELRRLVPEARFLFAHGQMPAGLLADTMRRFVAHEADVLVCSTIIESGLDIPRVNTIIIKRADRLGLAQLYQLRGRVGRASVRAFAYLLYDPWRSLSEVAQRRLSTILDATDLGAGFQVAMRDLEIRGAGNLLGAEQSGQIGAVGFTLFTQLLASAVQQVKAEQSGERPPPPRRGPVVSVDLPIARLIPNSYIEDLAARVGVYQRLAQAEEVSEVEAIAAELRDRFGEVPPPARQLLDSVRLRCLAARIGAVSVQHEGEAIVVRLADGLEFSAAQRGIAAGSGVEIGRRLLRYRPARAQPLAAALRQPNWSAPLAAALDSLAAQAGGDA